MTGGLRRFARPQRPRFGNAGEPHERCELCGERIGDEHSHMVDLEHRSIVCACRACALLFTRPGGRYSTVPDRVCHDPDAPLTQGEWAELQIPVGIAFFFVNSALGRVVASYPSPAGVTECELDLAAWDRLADTHPLLRAPQPDVEAILVAGSGPREAGPVETFLVPIDICYSLAGALRQDWHGFDGGDEVRQRLANLLGSLRERARRLARPMAQTATVSGAQTGHLPGGRPPVPPDGQTEDF
ncbi:MAG TPA: DUF5947 family protein [Trebonia sp.]|jgi:hypothetical protein